MHLIKKIKNGKAEIEVYSSDISKEEKKNPKHKLITQRQREQLLQHTQRA